MNHGNLLFYSTNTELAFRINEDYYGGVHYVWCSPVFDPTTAGRYTATKGIGTTSNPHEIYRELLKHVRQRDRHSPKITENKRGLIKGATFQMNKGNISVDEFGHIKQMIDEAETADFTPYIYLIPAAKIARSRIIRVPPQDRASLSGPEYRIEDLKRNEFEIIEINPW